MLMAIVTAGALLLAPASPAPSTAPGSGYVTTPTGRLFYETAGEGPTVVLIHDGLIHRETWDEQFATFASQYRVVPYDRRARTRTGGARMSTATDSR